MKNTPAGAPSLPTLRTSKGVVLDILEIDSDHVKAAYKNMLLMVWARRTLADVYRRVEGYARDLRVSHPKGVCVFQLVEDTAVPPETDARDAMAEFLKNPGIIQFSVVFEATGFKAAAVRAIVHAGQALSRPKFAHAVHQSVAAAASWHAGLSPELSASELQEAIQLMRDLHRARYPQG